MRRVNPRERRFMAEEQAKQFAANFRHVGRDLAADGNMWRTKDVPIFMSIATMPLWGSDVRVAATVAAGPGA